MDTPGGLVGELIEKGQQTTTSATSDVVSTVQDQVGLKNESASPKQTANTNVIQQDQSASRNVSEPTHSNQSSETNERTKEMVKDFYSPSDDYVQNTVQQQEQVDTDQRLVQVRQQLHQELHNEVYYHPLINPEKPVEESKVDQLEQQKQQELQELQIKEAQKPQPLAVQRAQISTETRVSAG